MSKVEVNQVTQQCGTTLTVGGGACKTAVVDATTVTLGRCGGTVSLASGATQSGFGRTGTVDWITTPKVTGDSPITGVTGKGYFLNTTAGTITINLPAGAAGSIVSMADYAATWQTNNVTVAANGSEKIGGDTANAILNTKGQSVTFVYVDSTQGWLNTMDSTSNVRGGSFIVATGGTPCAGTTCGDYKVHKFTGPGTFCVSSIGSTPGCNVADYLVVAGGGGGGKGNTSGGAGGGAGGLRVSPGTATGCWTASPLGVAPAAALPVSVQGYPIVVGGGGGSTSGSGGAGGAGVNSTFDSITSAGGGGGSGHDCIGATGGSGGGGTGAGPRAPEAGFAGNTPPTNPAQGQPGGRGNNASGPSYPGGGGGGAGGAGSDRCSSGALPGGPGGTGVQVNIDGNNYFWAGGGGGCAGNHAGGNGGTGGGGAGRGGPGLGTAGGCALNPGGSPPTAGGAGGDNTGGGGGAKINPGTSGAGGSGIVIIRYKFQ